VMGDFQLFELMIFRLLSSLQRCSNEPSKPNSLAVSDSK
jgi:hypothetical protein